MMLRNRYFAWYVLCVVAATFTAAVGADQNSARQKERELIKVLQSDAPPQDKAIPCKQLAIYGTKDAVPSLAALLPDAELSSWARIALEAIPDPAADAALREAMDKVQGRLLIGVINSIAYRRDAQAVDGLVRKLEDADMGVASAAAVALGRIGGDTPARALERSLADASAGTRSAVAQGCILCAEGYLAKGQYAEAGKLYDTVRRADLPKQRLLEATRGAILARQSAGVPLLTEQLRSTDKAYLGIGLRTARELEGRDVTEALATEMERLSPDRQPLLLLALADRRDPAVLPAVLKAAKSGPIGLRVEAAGVLRRLGGVSCVPVLLDAAMDDDAELAQTAKTTLAKLPGREVDADLLARLPQAAGRMRAVLIEIAGQRRMDGALTAVVRSLSDTDAEVRGAAVQTIGIIGEDGQAADLVKLLQRRQSAEERVGTEKALLAVSGRWGVACVPHLLPLMQSADSTLRIIGLHALAVVGGPDALAAVNTAIADRDEAVQDEAARTLSTWPNNWPEDADAGRALRELAESGRKTSHRVLGLRGYLQYVRGDKQLSAEQKVANVSELLPLVQRPEEKRLVIAVLGSISGSGAVELLATLAADPTVGEEACSALLGLATGRRRGLSRELRETSLRTVIERAADEATKRKAQEELNRIQ